MYFVGRYYEMVKSQGANVSPREVETVLEAWPEIKHVFVFGTPHPTREEVVTVAVCFIPAQTMTAGEAHPYRRALLRQERSRLTRDGILRAALDLWREKGFERTTVEDISARAEVGASTFYF